MRTFIVSDTHFYHKNIIKYCNRPYTDVNEMNKALIDNWNSTVGVNDTVYHLGDFSFIDWNLCKQNNIARSDSRAYTFNHVVKQLNGKIILLLGNHDVKYPNEIEQLEGFEKIIVSHTYHLNIGNDTIYLSHEPLPDYIFEGMDNKNSIYNLHGHIHDAILKDKYHWNCCVDAQHMNFKPMLFEEAVDMAKQQKKMFLDCNL